MAQLLSWSCRTLLLLPLIGICFTKFTRADGVRSEIHIFHHSCALKKDEGPCKALKDRFYFDTDTGRCESFEYGGCQGNENNFETLQECEKMCLVKEDKSPCQLDDEPGPCRGLVPRYFFDFKSQESALNNMERNAPLKPEEEEAKPKTEPLAKHGLNRPKLCFSPIDRGNCEGSEGRYMYNPRTKRCQMFHYSGCGGNKNNFVKRGDCIKMCMRDLRRKLIWLKLRNSKVVFRSVKP
ncbi:tissue factor pathway inhibitor isoform X5 [Cyprinus carpio]|uniref:Tissue factor pathway inhibitor n=1 Tax=Cyprinus carpio TaxID=7962 RepID=A0A9Q9YHQ8_CYPCA|nr:tissue factor pathway inhibitor isoform X5 [Cyprinus carpio]